MTQDLQVQEPLYVSRCSAAVPSAPGPACPWAGPWVWVGHSGACGNGSTWLWLAEILQTASVWEGNQFYALQDHNAVLQRQHSVLGCHTGFTSQLYGVNTHLSHDLAFVLCITWGKVFFIFKRSIESLSPIFLSNAASGSENPLMLIARNRQGITGDYDPTCSAFRISPLNVCLGK